MAELLFWPALIAYGEAAFAYAGELRGPGRYGRLGIWGVRIGWLAQTGLLVAQALAMDGFPWGTWAGALNFLSWLVVSGYLIWGCRPRYRLIGLAVMPIAVGLLALAWIGGGTGVDDVEQGGWVLATHAGLILAGFACFTVAAGGGARLPPRGDDGSSAGTSGSCGFGCPRSRRSTGSPRAWSSSGSRFSRSGS